MKNISTPLYEFYNPVKVHSGINSLVKLPDAIKDLRINRPCLITDLGVEKAGLVSQLQTLAYLELEDIYNQVPPDSSTETVHEISQLFNEIPCDGLIALGGGSVIDTAKAVSILISVNNKKNHLMDFSGYEVLKRPLKPLIAIPTTAGTGSEATGVAVIRDPHRNIKLGFMSQFLIPRVAFLDPHLTINLPPRITAATTMDALSHAIESSICLQRNPLSDAFGWTAIRLIKTHLLPVLSEDNTEERRLALANAAYLAGIALANSIAGVIHSLGHAVGGIYHVPHGEAMNIFLPIGLEYNRRRVGNLIGNLLLPFVGKEIFSQIPVKNRAFKVIQMIQDLKQNLFDLTGLPRTLTDLGISSNAEVNSEIAKNAINDGSVAFNPEPFEFTDALTLLQKAYENS